MSRRDEYDDERVVVVEQGGGNGIGMLLLGMAIGAGAALLFAPASGQETRERIQREARRAGKRVKDLTDEVGEGLADRVERARDAVRSRRQAMGDAVSAGREGAARARADLEQAVADTKQAYADSRRAFRDARRADEGGSSDAALVDIPAPDVKDSAEHDTRDG